MALQFAPVSLSCIYGMTWKQEVVLTDKLTGAPIDLTGCTLLIRIRDSLQSNDALIELSTADSTLDILEPLAGKFQIDVAKEAMQALTDPRPRKYRKYVYDMTIIRGTTHEPGIAGKFRLSAQVTRAWQPLT